MAKSLKQLVGLSKGELIAMGSQIGLTFHEGMRKVDMAQQLQASAASGWMEVNQELLSGQAEENYNEDLGAGMVFDGGSSLSDAAQIAQIISSAGYTETFHAAMNGPSQHVEAVHAYMENLGVSPDDVWMHMPKANPNIPARHFGSLNNYLRDTLSAHQDIMREIPGHYSGNIMDEYSTNQGGVEQSYNYLAHMYVDREQYNSRETYEKDISTVSSRLQSQMGGRFKEVAFASAIGSPTSYVDSLPRLGDEDIVRGVQNPRQPLNASGLPLGSYGSGINAEYSLSASLTGKPGWSPESKAIYSNIAESAKSLAKVYSGGDEKGLSVNRTTTSDRDMILDSASRYADIIDVRHGYDNLKRDVGDEPRYSGAAIKAVLGNANEYNEAELSSTFDPVSRIRGVLSDTTEPSVAQVGGDFTASFGSPTFRNPAFERREAKRIADLYAASSDFSAPNGSDSGRVNSTGPQYHATLQQGTPEWLAFRQDYDITGSTVGSYLGHNKYTSPIKEMSDKLGFGSERRENADMRRGHVLEPIARQRVAQQFGVDVQEVGAITNPDFPRMMYSPDGLIGDDALWEHKAPRKFFDLEDHQDYIDQVQLGMHLSNRDRTLFSQTVGNETRSQWVERDPEWFANNEAKLMSTLGRMDAGRSFMERSSGLTDAELKAGVRSTMTGEGIWGFQTTKTGNDLYTDGKRGMSKFSANAGTENDPFIRSTPSAATQPSESTNTDSMALSVKQGILAAQEENKQKAAASGGTVVDPNDPTFEAKQREPRNVDAEFDSLVRSSMYSRRMSDAGDNGNGGGGGNGTRTGSDWGDDLVRGMTGGTIGSVTTGAKSALMRSPWGLAAVAAYGTMTALNEGAEAINEYIGSAEDAGLSNPNEYSGMNLGLQQLGLSEQQAGRINATTHSAFNTLLNGDPSGAIRIVQGTRGLVTISDIRQAEGDPVALARVIRERGAERGWSQARIAGAMEMAGLGGMARAANRSDYSQGKAEDTVQRGRESDYAEGIAANDTLQANRADLNVSQIALSNAVSSGASVMNAGRDTIIETRSGLSQASSAVSRAASSVYEWIAGEESGNRDYNPDGSVVTSSTGAKGRMQVLSSTNRDPGFGVRPAQDDSLEERARVGRDYYDAMLQRYNGDARKAMAAYTDGPGRLDKAIEGYGEDWLTHMPAQAQNRVAKYDAWAAKGGAAQEGAGGFTRNGTSYGQAPVINVNINAKVNNQTASASVAVGNQTVNQTMNMGNGASQRR